MTERILWIKDQLTVGVDECRSGNAGIELAIAFDDAAFKQAADDAFLAPDLPGAQFSVGVKARHFCGSAGATRRAVVAFSRAEHKILAVRAGELGRAEKFDVIDFRATLPGDLLPGQLLADSPGELRKGVDVFESDFHTVILDEEEPIAAPSDVACEFSVAGNIHSDICSAAVTGDVFDGDFAVGMETRGDFANGRFDVMTSWRKFPQIGERDEQADGAVPTHSEVTDIIKKDDPGGRGGILGFAEKRADDSIRATRLVYHGGAEGVKLVAKVFEARGHRAVAEVRTAFNDDASRLAAGVGVDDADASKLERHTRIFVYKISGVNPS